MKFSALSKRFFLLAFSAIAVDVWGQKTEIGFVAGPSYYYGDIVNSFQPEELSRPGVSVFLRYHLDPRLALRGNFGFAMIGGSDSYSGNTPWQKSRNMSFKGFVTEVSGIAEFNLIPDKNKGRRVKTPFIPYVFAGFGFIYFESYRDNPVTGDKNVFLRPLQLDGTSYAPIAVTVPLGIGARYYLTRNWTIGVEFGPRWTSTSQLDNIDGNSVYPAIGDLPNQTAREMYDPGLPDPITGIKAGRVGRERGKIEYINDLYFIGGITVSYRIWPRGVRSYGGRAIRCPRFY